MLKRYINPTRVPIEAKESIRWLENMRTATALLGDAGRLVHNGDRENDIYEFFWAARDVGTHFLVRICVDRLAGDGSHTVAAEMAEVAVAGHHLVEIGDGTTARVALRYKRIHVLPPIGKQKRYPALDLTIVHAREEDTPEGRPAVNWKLITDLPVASPGTRFRCSPGTRCAGKSRSFTKSSNPAAASWMRGFRTAERLVNLIALFCVLAWRLFWMTMINRAVPSASPTLVLADDEIELLDRISATRPSQSQPDRSLAHYLAQIATLGGYLALAHDPPPGNTVVWRGWSRLIDIKMGAELASRTCG